MNKTDSPEAVEYQIWRNRFTKQLSQYLERVKDAENRAIENLLRNKESIRLIF